MKKEKIAFIVFFIITFIVSFFSKYQDGGDDLFYQTANNNYSLFNFVFYRYFNWSGRIIPEIFGYLFNGILSSLWPLFNSLIFTFLSILIFKYINLISIIKTHQKFLLVVIICFSFLLMDKTIIYPSFLWKTGSINYLWSTFFALLAFYPSLLSVKNKPINYNLFYFLISFLAGIFTEQISVFLILGSISYFIYMFIHKNKIPLIIKLMTINIFIGSLIVCLAPGNQIRFQIETQNNFYNFSSLSLLNRISISLYWILNKLINYCSIPLALIYLVLGSKKKSIISIIIALLLIIKTIFSFEYIILPITSNNYFSFNILIKYFISFTVLFLIPYFLLKTKHRLFLNFSTLLIILVTMAMVTLSPTMDVSGNRVLFLPMVLLNLLSISLIFKI